MVDGGELFDYIAIAGRTFSEKICRYYFKQMLEGIRFIHSKGILHGDLKP